MSRSGVTDSASKDRVKSEEIDMMRREKAKAKAKMEVFRRQIFDPNIRGVLLPPAPSWTELGCGESSKQSEWVGKAIIADLSRLAEDLI